MLPVPYFFSPAEQYICFKLGYFLFLSYKNSLKLLGKNKLNSDHLPVHTDRGKSIFYGTKRKTKTVPVLKVWYRFIIIKWILASLSIYIKTIIYEGIKIQIWLAAVGYYWPTWATTGPRGLLLAHAGSQLIADFGQFFVLIRLKNRYRYILFS